MKHQEPAAASQELDRTRCAFGAQDLKNAKARPTNCGASVIWPLADGPLMSVFEPLRTFETC